MSWLPEGFAHPERVELRTGHHLRPIRAADVEIDYPAVMDSRERLWAKYGGVGWPPETMTFEHDREDLARHEAEIAAADVRLRGPGREALFGCVYIDPPEPESPPGTDAVATWWVVDDAAGGELERALDDFVPRWLAETWGFGPSTTPLKPPPSSGGRPWPPMAPNPGTARRRGDCYAIRCNSCIGRSSPPWGTGRVFDADVPTDRAGD